MFLLSCHILEPLSEIKSFTKWHLLLQHPVLYYIISGCILDAYSHPVDGCDTSISLSCASGWPTLSPPRNQLLPWWQLSPAHLAICSARSSSTGEGRKSRGVEKLTERSHQHYMESSLGLSFHPCQGTFCKISLGFLTSTGLRSYMFQVEDLSDEKDLRRRRDFSPSLTLGQLCKFASLSSYIFTPWLWSIVDDYTLTIMYWQWSLMLIYWCYCWVRHCVLCLVSPNIDKKWWCNLSIVCLRHIII